VKTLTGRIPGVIIIYVAIITEKTMVPVPVACPNWKACKRYTTLVAVKISKILCKVRALSVFCQIGLQRTLT